MEPSYEQKDSSTGEVLIQRRMIGQKDIKLELWNLYHQKEKEL